jgi:creatinine amidohydrolase
VKAFSNQSANIVRLLYDRPRRSWSESPDPTIICTEMEGVQVGSRDLRRMDHLTWPEFQERLNQAVFVLPLGATEQHGYHMPLGVDVFLPLHLALRVADAFPAVIAPPLAYGYKSQPKSGGGGLFPGTTSLDGATLTASVRDFVRELSRQGQKSIVILNGHMENSLFASEGVDLALRELSGQEIKVVSINWWEHVGDDLLDRLFPEGFPGWEAEHAGLTETSMMMHFLPDLVIIDRREANEDRKPVPQYAIAPEPPGLVPASGVLHQAHGASAKKGEALANYLVNEIAQILRTEFPAFTT